MSFPNQFFHESNSNIETTLNKILWYECKLLEKLPISESTRQLYRSRAIPPTGYELNHYDRDNPSISQGYSSDKLWWIYFRRIKVVITDVEKIFEDSIKFVHEKLNTILLSDNITNYSTEKQEIVDYLLGNNEYVYFSFDTVNLIRNSLDNRVVILEPGELMNKSKFKSLYDLEKNKIYRISDQKERHVINSSLNIDHVSNINKHIYIDE